MLILDVEPTRSRSNTDAYLEPRPFEFHLVTSNYMDLLYNILDELSGSRPENQSATENSVDQEECPGRDSRMELNPPESNSQEGKTENFSFSDIDGNSRPCRRENSGQWESHRKKIEGESSGASDSEHSFKISKDIDLDSLAPWLNLDDLELQTSPSQFPPPSRSAPSGDIASSPSTSGQEYTQGERQREAKAKDRENFVTTISIKRRLSYELVEEDVYDDQAKPSEAGRHTKPPEEDLIDISTIDLDGNVVDDKAASELREKAKLQKQVGKVTKAIEEDLLALFGDNSIPTNSKTTTVDRKDKGVVGDGSRGARQPSAAVAMMKERDLKQQRETEEIEKAADELGSEIKKWSTGKEGNLRALLSSLQNILGPEFGWQPIPMTDLLESASVKRQYKRATLLVHPDKLQQKNATPRQKYIAEKVFGLLKDASKKFSSEEIF